MRRAAAASGFVVSCFALLALLTAAVGPPNYATTPQTARVAFGSVTASTAGTANTVLTVSGGRRILVCTNSLNQETELTWAGSDFLYLPASSSVAVDLGTNGLQAANGVVVGVYHLGVAPTSGKLGCSAW